MRTHFLSVFAAALALFFVFALGCIADDTAKLPTWKPDQKIVAGLGPEIVIDGAAFRLPETMHLTESKVQDNIRTFRWRGDPADNGIRPLFSVFEQPLDTLSSTDRKDPGLTSSAFIRLFHHLIINIVSDPQTSEIQRGTIAGQEFSREYFKGYNHRWLREMHGFDYATITKRAIFLFHVWDQEPLSKYSLPVYEASVQTFHPTDLANTPMPENLTDPNEVQDQQDQSN